MSMLVHADSVPVRQPQKLGGPIRVQEVIDINFPAHRSQITLVRGFVRAPR